MTNQPPPPVLDSARVVSYASVHDISYRRWGALIVDGKPLEQVPQLAICVNLGEDMGLGLFHCDDQWNVLGCAGGDSVDELKERAEKNYPGAKSRWVDLDTSVEDALRYYDAQFGGERCSFCGKRPFEVLGWVAGDNARICNGCIERFHSTLERRGGGG
jgi:hypothetical protein